jgi:hypothetical protein
VKPLPESTTAYVLRTSFSDPSAWGAIRTAIEAPTPIDGFLAYVQFVDDAAYEGMVKDQVVDLFRGRVGHTFVIVADDTSMTAAEHHLLVIDLARELGREFRAVPSAIQSIENNLSIANMDFTEFAGAVDEDGVFRDFPQ